jgi:16S rRNA (guanine527-N7)-methyltransferase
MNTRDDFIKSLGLSLSSAQVDVLRAYADLVWEKKDFINLTSVADKQEIWDRHICDGLVSAALIDGKIGNARAKGPAADIADFGAGAGYIGFSVAAALPYADVTPVEALEKRCKFMEWAVFKLGIKNVRVLNMRAGLKPSGRAFAFTLERAMGRIEDIAAVCAAPLKTGGLFMAYQASDGFCPPEVLAEAGVTEENTFEYALPCDGKKRKIALFRKI